MAGKDVKKEALFLWILQLAVLMVVVVLIVPEKKFIQSTLSEETTRFNLWIS